MLARNHQERAETGRKRRAGARVRARQLLALAVMAVMMAGSWLVKVSAAAGDLDTTFSGDGRQTTNFDTGSDQARGVAIQSDGKIVVVGYTYNTTSMNFDIALARYNTNGTLDTTFSTDGKQTTDFSAKNNFAQAVAIQSDGKIVVAGYVSLSSLNNDFALARYNTNGTLDTTFSTDGRQTTDFSGKNDIASGIVIQPNGKIVVAGQARSNNTGFDFALARYNTDGALDTTFSTDGKQTTDFGSLYDSGHAVALQANNKIVVAGSTGQLGGTSNFAVARYTVTGALDTTFSTDGKQTIDFFGEDDSANAVAIQANGKIVVAGYTYLTPMTSNFALVRYNGNGSLDDGSVNDSTPRDEFGIGGKVNTDFFTSHDQASAVAIQSDDKIVAAGSTAHANNTNYDFAVARYNINGALDNSFSGDGRQNTYFSLNKAETAQAIAIQANGRIVVAGTIEKSSTNYDFGLARYLGN